MWNRPVHRFSAELPPQTAGPGAWQTDAHPSRRLGWLFAALLIPAAAITVRLIHLQGVLATGFFHAPETTRVTYEWIPARCGRLLSADGRVLAEDAVRYEIHAHYRWLEEPPNALWLRRRALAGLSKKERRNRSRIAEREAAVRQQRDTMWRRLSRLTGRSETDLHERRAAIQRRIERMLQSVQRRRQQRRSQTARGPTARTVELPDLPRFIDDPPGFVQSLAGQTWQAVVRTLTTAPQRGTNDPLILPEQSDYHLLLPDVSPEMAAEIESHPELYPGLRLRITTFRRYPGRTLAAHLIGSRKPLQMPAAEAAAGGAADDENDEHNGTLPVPASLPPLPLSRGKGGLEERYDAVLRGRPGLRKVIRNHRGEILSRDIVRPPRAGRDVVVSLDAALQQQVERLLDAGLSRRNSDRTAGEEVVPAAYAPAAQGGGCIVVLDVHTGEILAAASAPRFDLNLLIHPDEKAWKKLIADPRRPFFPRSYRMALPPGSVFKVVSAVAALESGTIDPEEAYLCRGYLDRPDRYRCYIYRHYGVGHGPTTLDDALCRSCNVYFYQAARRMGPAPLVRWATRFGFGHPTGLDLPGERGGHLPSPFSPSSPEHGRSNKRRPWYAGDTLGLAIGQSRLTVTPLQIARLMAAVANGGLLVTPHLLRRFDTAASAGENLGVSNSSFPRFRIPGLSQATLARVRRGLWKVVQDPHGTGYKYVRLKNLEIAGKTGTAEVGGGQPDHAWFAGYAPANNPRVAFVVVLEHAGSGGRHAGPVAKRLVQLLQKQRILSSP